MNTTLPFAEMSASDWVLIITTVGSMLTAVIAATLKLLVEIRDLKKKQEEGNTKVLAAADEAAASSAAAVKVTLAKKSADEARAVHVAQKLNELSSDNKENLAATVEGLAVTRDLYKITNGERLAMMKEIAALKKDKADQTGSAEHRALAEEAAAAADSHERKLTEVQQQQLERARRQQSGK